MLKAVVPGYTDGGENELDDAAGLFIISWAIVRVGRPSPGGSPEKEAFSGLPSSVREMEENFREM